MSAIRNLQTLCRGARRSHLTLLRKSQNISKLYFHRCQMQGQTTLADLLTSVIAQSFNIWKGDSSVIIVTRQLFCMDVKLGR